MVLHKEDISWTANDSLCTESLTLALQDMISTKQAYYGIDHCSHCTCKGGSTTSSCATRHVCVCVLKFFLITFYNVTGIPKKMTSHIHWCEQPCDGWLQQHCLPCKAAHFTANILLIQHYYPVHVCLWCTSCTVVIQLMRSPSEPLVWSCYIIIHALYIW